jgi:hypothetical protein
MLKTGLSETNIVTLSARGRPAVEGRLQTPFDCAQGDKMLRSG